MRFPILLTLALGAGIAVAADGPATQTIPLDVKPVVLPTPEVQTQSLANAPAPSAEKPAAKAGKAAPKAGKRAAKAAPKPAARKAVKKPAAGKKKVRR